MLTHGLSALDRLGELGHHFLRRAGGAPEIGGHLVQQLWQRLAQLHKLFGEFGCQVGGFASQVPYGFGRCGRFDIDTAAQGSPVRMFGRDQQVDVGVVDQQAGDHLRVAGVVVDQEEAFGPGAAAFKLLAQRLDGPR